MTEEAAYEVELRIDDEIFIHNMEGTFAISAMKRFAHDTKMQSHPLPINPDQVEHCKRNDPVRARIDGIKTNLDALNEPIIVMLAQVDEKTFMSHILDGTHRVLARHELGLPDVQCFVFFKELAQQFRIDNREDLITDVVARDRETDVRRPIPKPEQQQ